MFFKRYLFLFTICHIGSQPISSSEFYNCFGINGVLKKQWTFSQLFNLLLYFSFCISIIILQHPLLIISIISVLDAAHTAINNNNVVHHRLLKEWDKASPAKTLYIFCSLEAVTEQYVAIWEPKQASSTSPPNTSAPGPFPALRLWQQPAATHLMVPDRLSRTRASLSREAFPAILSKNLLLIHSIPHLFISKKKMQNRGRWYTQNWYNSI